VEFQEVEKRKDRKKLQLICHRSTLEMFSLSTNKT
jgi:hypothetical protein